MQPKLISARQWSTSLPLVVIGWLATAAALAWWLLAEFATDRVFITLIVLLLGGLSTYGTILRPRLRVDETGITLRGLRGSTHISWSDAEVRLAHQERMGRRVPLLELDVPEAVVRGGLVVLSKWSLGEDPPDVVDAIRRINPTATRS